MDLETEKNPLLTGSLLPSFVRIIISSSIPIVRLSGDTNEERIMVLIFCLIFTIKYQPVQKIDYAIPQIINPKIKDIIGAPIDMPPFISLHFFGESPILLNLRRTVTTFPDST